MHSAFVKVNTAIEVHYNRFLILFCNVNVIFLR